MNLSYFTLIIVSLVLGLGTQFYINHSFRKWSKVRVSTGISGSQAARRMLDAEGLGNVPIRPNGGDDLSDYYDPRSNALYLSASSEHGSSVASMAVACHEAGHAVQHARNYMPARVRGAIVPLVNIGSQAWMLVLMLGIFMNVTGLITLGIVLFAFVVVFQLVTLPVEFDASRRALAYINETGVTEEEARGARQMLTAAALTYVAAALTSILQLVYLLQHNRDE